MCTSIRSLGSGRFGSGLCNSGENTCTDFPVTSGVPFVRLYGLFYRGECDSDMSALDAEICLEDGLDEVKDGQFGNDLPACIDDLERERDRLKMGICGDTFAQQVCERVCLARSLAFI